MLEKVAHTIEKYRMLDSGERVCIALSGGADSVSLLLAMIELGYDVFAVHVNHNLRGSESLRDEDFCKRLCCNLGVELHVESVDVRGYCTEKKLSCEEGARALRYQAIQKHLGGSKLCTAHNLNDCLETTLFNLSRGTGISGMAGIPVVRGNIVRPLIRVTRREIEEFLAFRNQDYVIDSTNRIDDCARNIIRLNVVSELERINPSLLNTYANTLENIESVSEYINLQAHICLENSRREYGYEFSEKTHDAVLAQALSILLRRNGIEPSYERIAAVKELCAHDGRINMKKDVYVKSKKGRISFETVKNDIAAVSLVPPGWADYGGRKIEFTGISQFDISAYNKVQLKWLLDADKIEASVVIRGYCGSEKIKLLGKDITQVIKKLLSVYPEQERKTKIVISDSSGALFVEGFGVAARAACSEDTNKAFKINILDSGKGL